jgi:hypothetical protein
MWIDLWWYLIGSDLALQSLNINMFSCCFLFLFVCVCLHVSLYISNHFNHCIKLFAPCWTLIDNNKFLFLFLFLWHNKQNILVLKTVTFYFIYCLFIQGEVAEMQNLRRSSNSVLESFFQDGKTTVNVETLFGRLNLYQNKINILNLY